MASPLVTIPIYQIGSDNTYDPRFPLFLSLPIHQSQVEDVSPPFNTTRGVQIYSQIAFFRPNPVYYSNLTKSEILELANDSGDPVLLTEDGQSLTTEDNQKITIE